MKKMIASLLLLCGVSAAVQAQDKGEFWIGGNLGWNTTKADASKALHNFRVLPELGYQFHDNWGVGIQLGYTHQQRLATPESRIYYNGLYVSPFVRYSYLKGNVAHLFVDTRVGYGYGKYTAGGEELHSVDAGFIPGIGIHLSDHLMLTAKAGFLGYQYGKAGSEKIHSGGFEANLDQVEIGARFKF